MKNYKEKNVMTLSKKPRASFPMKKNAHKTNDQLLKALFKTSKFGSLSEIFIMSAIVKEAKRVGALTPADFPEGSWVLPDAWIGVAKEIIDALDGRV